MIILLQSLLGGAVMAWHQLGGLPPLVAIPLAAWGVAFLGLWRIKRQHRQPRTIDDLRHQLGLAINQNPSPEQIAAAGLGIVTRPAAPKAPPPPPPTRAVRGDIRPGPPPPPPPPPTVEYVGRRSPPSVYCRHCLAELELAERFERESG